MLLTINVSPLLNIDEPRNCPCLASLVALAEMKHRMVGQQNCTKVFLPEQM